MDGVLKESTFIDLGVYTGNRNFRLILSSKYRERGIRPLRLFLPDTDDFIPSHDLTYEIFRKTLAGCNGIIDCNLLGWPSKPCPKQRLLVNRSHIAAPQNSFHRRVSFYANGAGRKPPVNGRGGLDDVITHYPKLHNYFTTDILPNWPRLLDDALQHIPTVAVVTKVEYSHYNRRYVYIKVLGNRYCHNVGRQHRRNNIYFVLDLTQFVFRQGCYDITCYGVLSGAVPIAPEVLF